MGNRGSVVLTMSAKQFNNWLEEVRSAGFAGNDADCAKLIGISRRTMLRYKQDGAGLTVSLACKNILHKLGPYT